MRPAVALSSLALACAQACAPEPTPRPVPSPAPTSAVARPAYPPLFTLANAERSPPRPPDDRPEIDEPQRADGKRHVVQRVRDGLVIFGQAEGAMGFVRAPNT